MEQSTINNETPETVLAQIAELDRARQIWLVVNGQRLLNERAAVMQGRIIMPNMAAWLIMGQN